MQQTFFQLQRKIFIADIPYYFSSKRMQSCTFEQLHINILK